jgi:hypothetical protein
MPDTHGRYNLLELRQYVLRNLASLRPTTVDPTTGAETAPLLLGLNAQFSKEALNLRINSSATKTALLVNAENETAFAAEVFYDANVGQTQYAVPPDLCQLRGLWWKDASIVAPARPDDYNPMSMQDTFNNPSDFSGQVGRPTWRRVGNIFQLNQDPRDFQVGQNISGIWVKYIKWISFLVEDTDYLDFTNARIIQECIVWDATLDSVRSQEEVVDASGVEKSLAYWNQQLEIVVRNSYRPPNIRLTGPSYVKNTFSGR